MNTTRFFSSLSARNVFAAAAVGFIASAGSVPAFAQQATRAEVRAAVGESYGVVAVPGSASGRTRAEVRATTLQAVRAGRISPNNGEG